MNQKQLSRLAGVSQQTLSKFETGRLTPSAAVAVRLAAILGVTPSDFDGADRREDVEATLEIVR